MYRIWTYLCTYIWCNHSRQPFNTLGSFSISSLYVRITVWCLILEFSVLSQHVSALSLLLSARSHNSLIVILQQHLPKVIWHSYDVIQVTWQPSADVISVILCDIHKCAVKYRKGKSILKPTTSKAHDWLSKLIVVHHSCSYEYYVCNTCHMTFFWPRNCVMTYTKVMCSRLHKWL